jgi:N-methylhydantoinase A/oxoprolinase/acetone carboxylase beta subunit
VTTTPSHRYSLGIDIGGTFTDIVVYDHAEGRQFSRKVLTTHDDPARGVLVGVDQVLAEDGVPAAAIGRVVHATPLLTNAMIERKGAGTGQVTTKGFRAIVEIGPERRLASVDLELEGVRPRPRRQAGGGGSGRDARSGPQHQGRGGKETPEGGRSGYDTSLRRHARLHELRRAKRDHQG